MPSYPLFQHEVLIRESHLDTFGHVNNASYLQIYEEVRWDLITSRGFGMKEILASGMGPTILEVQLTFKRELRVREKIVVHTQLESYESKVGILKQSMVNERGEVCNEMKMTFGLFDTRARKLIPPTPERMKALGA